MGSGLQPFGIMGPDPLGRCPRLRWIGPLALMRSYLRDDALYDFAMDIGEAVVAAAVEEG